MSRLVPALVIITEKQTSKIVQGLYVVLVGQEARGRVRGGSGGCRKFFCTAYTGTCTVNGAPVLLVSNAAAAEELMCSVSFSSELCLL